MPPEFWHYYMAEEEYQRRRLLVLQFYLESMRHLLILLTHSVCTYIFALVQCPRSLEACVLHHSTTNTSRLQQYTSIHTTPLRPQPRLTLYETPQSAKRFHILNLLLLLLHESFEAPSVQLVCVCALLAVAAAVCLLSYHRITKVGIILGETKRDQNHRGGDPLMGYLFQSECLYHFQPTMQLLVLKTPKVASVFWRITFLLLT